MAIHTRILSSSPKSIQEATEALKTGRLVAFPTETVYGLGGNALMDMSVASIYEAKGRPSFNPLIIHGADKKALKPYVCWSPLAEKLAAAFWPGPLTLVLPRSENCPISLLASGGLDTLAIRVPSHPIAIELLRQAEVPVAAPSANRSGKLSPTTAAHVAEDLDGYVPIILDGGHTMVGVESTVLDLTTPMPTLLRPGGLAREEIEKLIGRINILKTADNEIVLKSPGLLTSHYAPDLPVRLDVTHADPDEAFLCFGNDKAARGGKIRLNLSQSGNLTEAAGNLFSMLHQLDKAGCTRIAVMPIPNEGLGTAIIDRLSRAAAPRD